MLIPVTADQVSITQEKVLFFMCPESLNFALSLLKGVLPSKSLLQLAIH